MIAEFLHRGSGNCHVFEHALKFRRELAAALVLQFRNHVLFAIVRDTLVEQQSLGCGGWDEKLKREERKL